MAGKKVSAIRLQIIVMDEDGNPIEKRGARYDLVEPAKYTDREVADAIAGTARRTVDHILAEGVR